MATPHGQSGEVIDIGPLGDRLSQTNTHTLVKSDGIVVMRLVVPAGKEVPAHKAAGPITVQCLEGRVEFSAHGQSKVLEPGQMLYLSAGEMHAVKGVQDASLLVTVHLPRKGADSA